MKKESSEKKRTTTTASRSTGGAATALAPLNVPRLAAATAADSVGLIVAPTETLGTLGLQAKELDQSEERTKSKQKHTILCSGSYNKRQTKNQRACRQTREEEDQRVGERQSAENCRRPEGHILYCPKHLFTTDLW
jgi:hypothetical protein